MAKPIPLAAPVTITELFFEVIFISSDAAIDVKRPRSGDNCPAVGSLVCGPSAGIEGEGLQVDWFPKGGRHMPKVDQLTVTT